MNTLHIRIRSVGIWVVITALLVSTGCAKMSWKPSKMFSLDNTWPFHDKDEPREGTPNRITCTWTDTVMSQPGKPSQRGFGGRIMFYEANEKDPIKVDGQLIVYAFDETDRDPTDNKPTRRYVFPPEQVPLHMSKSEIGASYSFFLPWDEAGGPRTEVSLICRFEPKGGAVIGSEQTRQVLPGKLVLNGKKEPLKVPLGVPSKPAVQTLQSVQAQRNDDRNAQLANYEVPTAAQSSATSGVAQAAYELPDRRMSATTINLPGNFQMPSAAAFMSSQQAGAESGQALAPPMQQPTVAPVVQPARPTYQTMPAVQQSGMLQPPMTNRIVAGPQTLPNATTVTMQPAQMPMSAGGGIMPGTAAMPSAAATFSTTPAIQSPLTQQQMQLAAQQSAMQQAMQQQFLQQQQALQQRIGQPQMPMQSPTPQVAMPQTSPVPLQASSGASVSYPTGTTYLR